MAKGKNPFAAMKGDKMEKGKAPPFGKKKAKKKAKK